MKKKIGILFIVITFIFNSSILLSFASSKESRDTENKAIPQVEDFTYSNTTLTGLSANYINSLAEQQKQNIVLNIPAKTTAIADGAFWMSKANNQGLRFIALDLTQSTNLQQIGSNAFYGCSYLTGDLLLPNTITSIGSHAFDGCKGLTGQLQLSNQLTMISSYAFYNCGFTGTLQLPEHLVSIGDSAFRQSSSYQGFTGELVLPDTLQTIDKVAFAYQKGITSLHLSNLLTTINDSVFKGTGLQGTLDIPDTIQSIGSSSFAETSLEIVSLPKRKDESNTNFIQSTSFNTTSLVALICDKDDYNYLYSKLNSATKAKLGYEIDVSFIDSQNNTYDTIHCLYNRPYNLQKQDSIWNTIKGYTFPTVKNKPNQKWGLTSISTQPVSETSLVSKDTLYAIDAWQDASFTYSEGINKVYDGKPSTLSVQAYHPLAKPVSEAKVGDVIFYYTWSWNTIGSNEAVAKGFDVNTYEVRDVRMPDYAIGCSVKIQTCVLKEGNKASQIAVTTHTFSVHLQQAEPNVNPIVDIQKRLITQGLPEITLSPKDTDGTICFDTGQELKLGVHTYSWTFTPAKNTVGNSNYKVIHGEIEIEAVDKFSYTVNVIPLTHGKVLLTKSVFDQGEDVAIGFKAEAGYCLDSVYLDGQDITKNIVNEQYILKSIEKDYVVKATYKLITNTDLASAIAKLPDIQDNSITNALRVTILETVADYVVMKSNSNQEVSKVATTKLYNVLAKLPQVNVTINQPSVHSDNLSTLLESLSITDINELLSNQDTNCNIIMQVEETNMAPMQAEKIATQMKNVNMIKTLDISVFKELESKTPITSLHESLTLSFDIPSDLPKLKAGYKREFFVVRFHDNETSTDMKILQDEDHNENTISIHTDRFSTYVLGYRDVHTSLDEQGTQDNEENTLTIQEETIQPNTNVETGDQTLMKGSIIVCVITITLIGTLLFIKKRD